MKTIVVMTCSDQQHSEWKSGEKGYIDGYVTNHHGAFVMVVLNTRLIACKYNQFCIIGIADTPFGIEILTNTN